MIYDGDDDIDFDCEAYAAESMMRLEDGLEESEKCKKGKVQAITPFNVIRNVRNSGI